MQNTKIIATYDYYTLDQARQIIAEENRQKVIRRAERKEKHKRKIICYIKQKLLGLAAVGCAIACPIVLDGDTTASIFFLPIGLYMFFTKEII